MAIDLGLCELMGDSGVLVNDDNELMFLFNGYFPGEPLKKTIYYTGGAHGILERNDGEYMVINDVNEHVREAFNRASYVLVKEMDSAFMYQAKVVHEEHQAVLEQALEERAYSVSKKHPYPLHTGAYKLQEAVCDCCGKPTKIIYQKPTQEGDSITLCPTCECYIPKYQTQNTSAYFWPEHCGEEGVYLGKLREEDISKEMWMEYLKNWNYEGNTYARGEAKALRERLKEGTVEAHLFRCDVCQVHFVYWIDIAGYSGT